MHDDIDGIQWWFEDYYTSGSGGIGYHDDTIFNREEELILKHFIGSNRCRGEQSHGQMWNETFHRGTKYNMLSINRVYTNFDFIPIYDLLKYREYDILFEYA